MKSDATHVSQSNPRQRDALRVLLIEDSEFDAELITRYLQNNGSPCTTRRVWNKDTMSKALDQDWDVVLCDFQLPGFGVLEALQLLRSRDFNLPFIIVSGAIGEEQAVDLLKAGADDFIVKDRLSRLIPAIDRELREAEAVRERMLAREKLAYLAAIVDSAEEAIIGQTMDGTITTWNTGAKRLYGYSEEEAVGQPASMIVPDDQREQANALFAKMLQGEMVEQFETIRRRKDGALVDVSITLSAIRDRNGKIIGASSIGYDVTERKRMEEERTHLIAHLNEMLSKVKTLSGLLPICASCKKIRDDKGYWQQLETFVREHSGAEFSHSICPDCMHRLYPQFAHHMEPRPPG